MLFNRKSQASTFIIVAVLFLVMLITVLIIISNSNTAEIKESFQTMDIEPLVKSCIIREVDNAVYLIAMQGGYLNYPSTNPTMQLSSVDVAYWIYNKTRMPIAVESIQSEIEAYLNFAVPMCIGQSNNQYQLEFGTPSSRVVITEDEILADVNPSIRAIRGDAEKYIGKNTVVRDIKLGKALNKANAIMLDLIDGKKDEQIYTDKDIFIISSAKGDYDYIYLLVDNQSTVHSKPFQFSFAVQVPMLQNYPPVISKIPALTLKCCDVIYIDYNASDDYPDYQLTYQLSSVKIPEINATTGVIEFMPDSPGIYQGVVTVIDGFGIEDSDALIIEVEP
jgi:hypothetical protein